MAKKTNTQVPQLPLDAGEAIYVCTNGFVFIGRKAEGVADSGTTLCDAVNVRVYGTEGKGLAALAYGPTSQTVVDFVGVIHIVPGALLLVIPLAEGSLAKHLAVANRV